MEHGFPVLEKGACEEGVPAGGKVTRAEFDVEEEEDGEEVLGDGYGYWGTVEAPVEFLMVVNQSMCRFEIGSDIPKRRTNSLLRLEEHRKGGRVGKCGIILGLARIVFQPRNMRIQVHHRELFLDNSQPEGQ